MKINTIYIISKGRPQCRTADALTRMGYRGEWFIVCGNNDETIEEYRKNWGNERVLEFDWYEQVKRSDLMDNFGVVNMGSGAVPVRNATRDISKKRGETRHWQFDDDYLGFKMFDNKTKSNRRITAEEFERRLYQIAEFGVEGNLPNVGFALASDTFPDKALTFSRRIFNAHNLTNGDNFTEWKGRMNDDLINAITVYQNGMCEYSFKFLCMEFPQTQSEAGGNTDIYKEDGTVRKTAYAVMADPLNVKLVVKFGRYHHEVNWSSVCPKLIHEKYAKI